MFNRYPLAIATSLVISSLAGAPLSQAQESMVLEEIIVTARKREDRTW
jgi:hypothetical protein